MHGDTRISAGIESIMNGIAVPSAPVAQILQLAHRRRAPRALIAASIAVALLLPLAIPGFANNVELGMTEILHRLEHAQPPAMSASDRKLFHTTLNGIRGLGHTTVAEAQAHVKFTIVTPAGLPSDVSSQRVAVTVGMAYSTKDKTWAPTPAQVSFTYTRANRGDFSLLARRDKPGTDSMGSVVYEAAKDTKGILVLVPRQRFEWRNGDQLMIAVTAHDLSAAEIEHIRDAMGGTPVPTSTGRPSSPPDYTVIEKP